MLEVAVKEAPLVWNSLKGLICVYKPAEVTTRQVRKSIITKICSELNEMECRPARDRVFIEGDPLYRLNVQVRPDLADDPLVVGPRYQPEDLPCSWSNYLGTNTSGVLLLGLRRGTTKAKLMRENYPARAYHVKGTFGQATDNCFKTGKIVEKSTYRHIKPANLNHVLYIMQAAHQKKMFELSGVDIQSQAAYELAVKGPIRPVNSKIPLIYGIRCIHLDLPHFTIELECINEYETYLTTLIHEIGIKMNSTAHCTGIQCIRHAYFTLEHALLRKHWTLQEIMQNLKQCDEILEKQQHLTKQESAALRTE